ncbi:MAG: P27 family phage terminase small subunit [Pirellulales bacterium]|nr:P27 family phage terminase small subunit [Pirellulales bacterium]
MSKTRQPPAYLSREAKTWFRRVANDFSFDTEVEWQLLAEAAGCVERIGQARTEIKKHGLIVTAGSGSLKPNPAVNVERDCRILLARLTRELRLVDPADDERIPRIGGR